MKRIYVLRHAKSSWDDPDLADFDRPLNERGLEAAPLMGKVLSDRAYIPDVILSSPAKRAAETARLVKRSAGIRSEIRFDDRIYEASPQTISKVLGEVENGFESVMIVGHNPGIEGLIRLLSGQVSPMPTAAVAVLDLEISKWSEIAPQSARLVEVIRPKELK